MLKSQDKKLKFIGLQCLNFTLKYNNVQLRNSALNCLENVNQVLVKQEDTVRDFVIGGAREPMYKYAIYNYELKSLSVQRLLNCNEIEPSDINMYAGNRRQINIEVTEPFTNKKLLRFTKPMQFSYFQKNRPYLQLEYLDQDLDSHFIGEVRSPFSWSSFNYQILDEEYKIEYSVVANMHTNILLSRLMMKSYMKCEFIIFENEDQNKEVGKIVSQFFYHERKKQTISDLFVIYFPKQSSVEQKCRILGMSILNDFWIYGGLPKLQLAYNYA